MQERLQVGDIIGNKYRVDRELGRGSMGVVLAATHLDLQQPRAIKVMHQRALEVPGAVNRFLQEAQALCSLESEHVAKVFDVGEHDGHPFMVMEYLEGQELGALLEERKTLPLRDAALYVIQVCEALAEAHALGIVHRDIKPANLLLTRRKDGAAVIKVLDFGLSKALYNADGPLSPRGAVIGSPSYMSPEQINGEKKIDARSDIWSIGVLLYRMLTSQRPFRSSGRVGFLSLMHSISTLTPLPPSELLPELPTAMDAIILRCLEKDPEDRYFNVAELAVALAPFAPLDAAPLIARIRKILGQVSDRGHHHSNTAQEMVLSRHLGQDTSMTNIEVGGPGTLSSARWNMESPRGAVPTSRRVRSLLAASAIGFVLAVAGLGASIQHSGHRRHIAWAHSGITTTVTMLTSRISTQLAQDQQPDTGSP